MKGSKLSNNPAQKGANEAYKSSNRRLKNKLSKLKRHIHRQVNDLDALKTYIKLGGKS